MSKGFSYLSVLLGALGLYCTAGASSELPDLVVTDIAVNAECRPVVTLRNQGSGSLLSAADYGPTGISVQFIKGDKPFGGWSLLGAEIEAVRTPGGSLTKIFPPLIEGDVEIQVILDSTDKVSESNETNNTLTRSLSCALPLPDLAVTNIRFTDDCRTIVSLANLGDAPLPDGIYGPLGSPLGKWSWIERSFDDVVSEVGATTTLKHVDPARSLQPPGGTLEWTDNGSERAGKHVRYHWKVSTTLHPSLREKNLNVTNNALEATPPARCLPDLVVSDLRLDDRCHILATLRNTGTGPLPTAALRTTPPFTGTKVGIQFAINGKGAGGWMLSVAEASALETPGGSITIKSTSRVQGPAPAAGPNVMATVDANRLIPEANETNNTLAKGLGCPGPTPPTISPTRPRKLKKPMKVQPKNPGIRR